MNFLLSLLCSVLVEHHLFHMPSFVHTSVLPHAKGDRLVIKVHQSLRIPNYPMFTFKNKIFFKGLSGYSYMWSFSCSYLWHSCPTIPNEDRDVFPLPQNLEWGLPITLRPEMSSFLYTKLLFCTPGFCKLFLLSEVLTPPSPRCWKRGKTVKCFQIQNWGEMSFLLNKTLGPRVVSFSLVVKYLSGLWPHIFHPPWWPWVECLPVKGLLVVFPPTFEWIV